jgi:hypothetical protein
MIFAYRIMYRRIDLSTNDLSAKSLDMTLRDLRLGRAVVTRERIPIGLNRDAVSDSLSDLSLPAYHSVQRSPRQ